MTRRADRRTDGQTDRRFTVSLTLLRILYETVARPSVRLSVLPVIRPPHAAAAGLLLRARRAGDRSTAARVRRSAANASSVTLSAEHRLVNGSGYSGPAGRVTTGLCPASSLKLNSAALSDLLWWNEPST